MANRKHVHRDLQFGPGSHSGGADVTQFKRAVARELGHRELGFLVHFDSAKRAPATIAHAIFAMGLTEKARRAARRGHVGKWTQRKIRNPRLRSPLDRARERRRKPTLRKWREHHREDHPTQMYDSVDVAVIPPDAPAVAGYVGGSWPTYPDLRDGFPNAQLVSIAVAPDQDADVLDVEPGDATPADAPDWYRRQLRRREEHAHPGVYNLSKPAIYCSVSNAEEVVRAMAVAGIHRGDYLLWTAHVGEGRHVCGPRTCAFPGLEHDADGTQWTWEALGRNLDESVLERRFFA